MCGRYIKATLALTACVFKAVDSIGQKADTAQKASSLLLMDLLVIPHADGDGIRFSNVSVGKEKRRYNRYTYLMRCAIETLFYCSTNRHLVKGNRNFPEDFPGTTAKTHPRHGGYY